MTRRVVRRSETNLGSFMLPALATLVAPHAVAEWEFVELHGGRRDGMSTAKTQWDSDEPAPGARS